MSHTFRDVVQWLSSFGFELLFLQYRPSIDWRLLTQIRLTVVIWILVGAFWHSGDLDPTFHTISNLIGWRLLTQTAVIWILGRNTVDCLIWGQSLTPEKNGSVKVINLRQYLILNNLFPGICWWAHKFTEVTLGCSWGSMKFFSQVFSNSLPLWPFNM